MSENVHMTLEEVDALAMAALTANDISTENARMIADTVLACERDHCSSHGLMRVPGICVAAGNGRVDGHAKPAPERIAPSLLRLDARGGFAAPAMRAGREPLAELAREQGVGAMGIVNSFHFGALWTDVEPLAELGLVAMTFVDSTAFVTAFGGKRPIFGTNPLAFACPRPDGPPMVFDMATSQTARGEINLANIRGHSIPEGWAIDNDGRPTTDAAVALEGALLPYGGAHKGSGIALMVELLAAGLTGGYLSFEATERDPRDGGPANGGQLVVAFAPERFAQPSIVDRVEALFERIREAGAERLPSDRRHAARARSETEGVQVARGIYERCMALCGEEPPIAPR